MRAHETVFGWLLFTVLTPPCSADAPRQPTKVVDQHPNIWWGGERLEVERFQLEIEPAASTILSTDGPLARFRMQATWLPAPERPDERCELSFSFECPPAMLERAGAWDSRAWDTSDALRSAYARALHVQLERGSPLCGELPPDGSWTLRVLITDLGPSRRVGRVVLQSRPRWFWTCAEGCTGSKSVNVSYDPFVSVGVAFDLEAH